MIKPINKDILFLQQKAQPATQADTAVMRDLRDTMFLATRSLILPPGFKNSALAKIFSPVVPFKLISGVFPIKSITFS